MFNLKGEDYMYYNNLTRRYPLSKTIRNELRPVGRTLENIHKNRILESDTQRKNDYERVKKIMDQYHKQLINEAMGKCKLSDNLEKAADIYLKNQTGANDMEIFSKLQDDMRKEVVKSLKSHENYSKIGKKDILDLLEKLPFVNEEDFNSLESFRSFYTYFSDYNKVRENLYSDEEKDSTVAYRLINENLPKFLDNVKIYRFVSKAGIIAEGMTKEEQDSFFVVGTFNNALTQHGIDIYNQHIGYLNSAINLYDQKNHGIAGFMKIPKMKELYKQILSDREGSFIEEFSDDDSLIENVDAYKTAILNYIMSDKIKQFYDALKESKGINVYVKNDVAKTTLSNIVFGSWNKIDELINAKYDLDNEKKKKNDKYYDKRQKDLKKNHSYSLNQIILLNDSDIEIIDAYIKKISDDVANVISSAGIFTEKVLNQHDRSKKLSKNTKAVKAIKDMLDSIKELERDIKLINGSRLELDKNLSVYSEQEALINELEKVDALYNMTRNYLTKKPFTTDKIKLNFDRPTLLKGWDKNKEVDNLGILFCKEDKFYLGIMNTSSNKVFVNPPKAKSSNVYKKVDYKLLPGPNKMLPKVFFADSNIDFFRPSEKILSNYEKETHKKGDSFSLEDCHNLIDFFKTSISRHPDWSQFGFKFSDTSTYNDISDFYREVEAQGYKITFTDIDESYINDLVDKNELYLFQIYNKDFSPFSKGNLNLHTLYFKMLFDQRNLDNVIYKLNGEAEVFYRPASIEAEELIIHKAGIEIDNKNPDRAKKKRTSIFDYDIVKDKRYSEDKFYIHIPVTMNFGVVESGRFNDLVNNAVKNDENVNIIGIDRGERNLLYVVVIDLKGKILEQISLNTILNKEYDIETDYHGLLDEKEDKRDKARKDWGTIENIKELKEGYLSQVVNVIAKLVLKYNAIICLEDLNFGFKRGRQKVEKQVYQKFEKMLIDKFNYLVIDKSREQKAPEAVGGALNALQMTSKFEGFNKLGKQSGIIYYVPAYLTSKIDPTTGFANLFYVNYESVDKSKEFFSKFDFIRFNDSENYYEFGFDYGSFTQRSCGVNTKWVVCTYGERIIKFRNPDKNNSFEDKIISVTDELKSLFDMYSISYHNKDDIRQDILAVDEADLYRKLVMIFQKTLQMRNSLLDGHRDYIISPVKNERGEFYNSELSDGSTPVDADANGAYNIARKGIWVLNQIRENSDDKKIKLAMSNADWLEYAQTHTL